MQNKNLAFMALSCLICQTQVSPAGAQTTADSLKMERLQEVVVSGVRTQKNAPYAVTNLKRQELAEFSTTGQELPFLFARTPGVIAWSENGLATGTTYMRIRGAGDSRINVTLDGVPLNSPEDQCVFWANMNSYGALLGSVQIQRGVGTSTNGDGAFGGTVALATKAPSTKPQLELSGSYGSYNTMNLGGQFSTGLLWHHLIFDGAYHETRTDGFIHGTDGRSGSYYGGPSDTRISATSRRPDRHGTASPPAPATTRSWTAPTTTAHGPTRPPRASTTIRTSTTQAWAATIRSTRVSERATTASSCAMPRATT